MPERSWWQRGAIYQVYPRSFADSDGDGIGDLRGVISRLDHLSDLGVEALWLSPVYRSPMADHGYDVSDHCDIDPTFGTLGDLDCLLAEAHARGIRVVMEWIANHTSEQHPWFLDARSSRSSRRRDWYVWSDEPNDWLSHFPAVGSAWTFDAPTGQWYLHSFTRQQPDLNWENPEVRTAMLDVLRFWLDRGVDGFRLDAISSIAKDPLLRDNAGSLRRHDQDWDTIHERLREIRRVVDDYEDRMVVGEVLPMDVERVISYAAGDDRLHLAHNFVFVEQPWDAAGFRASIDAFDAAAWPTWFLSNHDYPRVASRFDQDGQGFARARAVALLLYSLRGTPFVFQGEELGLPDASIPAARVRDIAGRDPSRAPLPWRPPSAAGPGAGFTAGEPWLPLVAAAEDLCVERQAADPHSMLALVRRLAWLRATTPALRDGALRTLDAGDGVLSWMRDCGGDRVIGVMNFTAAPVQAGVRAPSRVGSLLISSNGARNGAPIDLASLTLEASEAVLVRV